MSFVRLTHELLYRSGAVSTKHLRFLRMKGCCREAAVSLASPIHPVPMVIVPDSLPHVTPI